MTGEQWKNVAKRWIRFLIPPILIVAVIIGYVIFLRIVAGNMTTNEESFIMFREYIADKKDSIVRIAEYEINSHGADDNETYDVPLSGEEQEARDDIFGVSHKADNCISEVSGARCVRFYYRWYGMGCVAIYDKGNAAKYVGTEEYSEAITDDIAVCSTDTANE